MSWKFILKLSKNELLLPLLNILLMMSGTSASKMSERYKNV